MILSLNSMNRFKRIHKYAILILYSAVGCNELAWAIFATSSKKHVWRTVERITFMLDTRFFIDKVGNNFIVFFLIFRKIVFDEIKCDTATHLVWEVYNISPARIGEIWLNGGIKNYCFIFRVCFVEIWNAIPICIWHESKTIKIV